MYRRNKQIEVKPLVTLEAFKIIVSKTQRNPHDFGASFVLCYLFIYLFNLFLNEWTADTYLEFTYSKYYSKDTVDNGR